MDAAQIQVQVISSFPMLPNGTVRLDGNLPDLEPRDHIAITAGVTNLPLSLALNTTTLPNGFHELTAVLYEGTMFAPRNDSRKMS